MKLSQLQMQTLVEKVFSQWQSSGILTYKADPKKVMARAILAVQEDYAREAALEQDVHKMLDQLEKEHGGSFQRHKMFTLLKEKLAKERNIVL